MKKEITRALISKLEIEQRVIEIGNQISKDYKDKNLILICILEGAVIFFFDLLYFISVSIGTDFIRASSYKDGIKSSGKVIIDQKLDMDIESRHVIIIDDIIDSGLTLKKVCNYFLSENPASIEICVLLNKKKTDQPAVKYTGFDIEDEFVGWLWPGLRGKTSKFAGYMRNRFCKLISEIS